MTRRATLIQNTSGFFSTILAPLTEAIIETDEYVHLPEFMEWLMCYQFLEVYNIASHNHNHKNTKFLNIVNCLKSKIKGGTLDTLFSYYIKMPRVYTEQEVTIIVHNDVVKINYDGKCNDQQIDSVDR